MLSSGKFFVITQFVLFIIFAIVPRAYALEFPEWLRLGGALLIPYGLVLVVWSIWYLRRALNVFPTPRSHAELITDGPFRRIRHPIYSGLLLLMVGYGLWSVHLPRLFVAVALGFLFYYKARYEEQLLRAHFPEYAAYERRTGRLWPRFF